MPSIMAHGLMGYLLYGKYGLLYSMLPDMIGFTRYFIRLLYNYYLNGIPDYYFKGIPDKRWMPKDKMDNLDNLLYKISHSIVIWIILYILTKNKYILGAILAISLDILLHTEDYFSGPEFLYPLSNIRYNGIHWNTSDGHIIQIIIIIIICIYKNKFDIY